jgi:hypothetical protein
MNIFPAHCVGNQRAFGVLRCDGPVVLCTPAVILIDGYARINSGTFV